MIERTGHVDSFPVISRSLRKIMAGPAALVARASGIGLSLALLFAAGSASAGKVTVATAADLQNAVAAANSTGGNTTILLQDGTYTVTNTLNITAPHVTISSVSGNRDKVIIQGDAMSATAAIGILVRADASYFTISNVTLQLCGWSLLQVVGEDGASNAIVNNVVFKDAYQQLLKVSVDQTTYAKTSNNGLIENSLFEYTAGIGPEYYIGGIDIHAGQNWVIRGNTFLSIISPSNQVAEFAIHVWDQSANALVEKNLIINCDRGIGFGLSGRPGNTGGIIRNNMIYHAANDGAFEDVGIDLELSPGTQVYNNSIWMDDSYPNAIEYRFTQTTGVLIVNNLSNKAVLARDGAIGTVGNNVTTAVASWFVGPASGDLRLTGAITGVTGAGQPVAGLVDDFYGDIRPQTAPDIGADQLTSTTLQPPSNLRISPVP